MISLSFQYLIQDVEQNNEKTVKMYISDIKFQTLLSMRTCDNYYTCRDLRSDFNDLDVQWKRL